VYLANTYKAACYSLWQVRLVELHAFPWLTQSRTV